jgi:TetR/AcrR family transcriptional regulator, regulator of mycofactocin system
MSPTTLADVSAEQVGPVDPSTAGLRERKKLETRRALIDATIDLSSRNGFEATTVDDIAAAVGVSARTFHRYFARKEDAVLGDSPARLERFRERLAAADGTVLEGVRAAALVSAAELDEARVRERARARLVALTPALRAHNLGLYDEWAAAIAEHAAAAVGEQPTDRWPATVGAATMAALSAAIRRWAAVDGVDLVAEYGEVLDLLAGLDRPRRVRRPSARGRR